MLAVLLNFKLDESYTPRQMKVRGGSTFADLQELQSLEVSEPQGWVIIPLADRGSAGWVARKGPHTCVPAACVSVG